MKEESEKIIVQKSTLQQTLRDEQKYIMRINALDKEKKQIIKNWTGFENTTGKTDKKQVEGTDVFKAWKADINVLYSQKVNDIKDELNELYQIKKAQTLADYPIFMAIAQEIGYDATGKAIATNELDIISEKLTEFINAIEEDEL